MCLLLCLGACWREALVAIDWIWTRMSHCKWNHVSWMSRWCWTMLFFLCIHMFQHLADSCRHQILTIYSTGRDHFVVKRCTCAKLCIGSYRWHCIGANVLHVGSAGTTRTSKDVERDVLYLIHAMWPFENGGLPRMIDFAQSITKIISPIYPRCPGHLQLLLLLCDGLLYHLWMA